jgi:hypothetical protein
MKGKRRSSKGAEARRERGRERERERERASEPCAGRIVSQHTYLATTLPPCRLAESTKGSLSIHAISACRETRTATCLGILIGREA